MTTCSSFSLDDTNTVIAYLVEQVLVIGFQSLCVLLYTSDTGAKMFYPGSASQESIINADAPPKRTATRSLRVRVGRKIRAPRSLFRVVQMKDSGKRRGESIKSAFCS